MQTFQAYLQGWNCEILPPGVANSGGEAGKPRAFLELLFFSTLLGGAELRRPGVNADLFVSD